MGIEDIKKRGASGLCLCCGSKVIQQTTLISAFLAKRAWCGTVDWSDTNRCPNCGFAFHGRGLADAEVEAYYKGYRDYDYFAERNHFEPFYTRKTHDSLGEWLGSSARKMALANYLKLNAGLHGFACMDILDYGGGSGRLISGMNGNLFVYDVGDDVPEDSVAKINQHDLEKKRFDLVICAQMLEHVSDPLRVLKQLYCLLKPGGFLYVEVPYDETWRDFSCSGWIRNLVLGLARRNRFINLFVDIYGTFFRVKLKVLPPFGYVPVREHLQYFTPRALESLGKSIDASVIDASREVGLGTVLLLRNDD